MDSDWISFVEAQQKYTDPSAGVRSSANWNPWRAYGNRRKRRCTGRNAKRERRQTNPLNSHCRPRNLLSLSSPWKDVLYRCLARPSGERSSLHLHGLWYAWIDPQKRMIRNLCYCPSAIASSVQPARNVRILCTRPVAAMSRGPSR